MKTAIVVTTISKAELLTEYVHNIEVNGHSDVAFITIGDMKTPHDANKTISDQIIDQGFDSEYWDPIEQKKWMTQFRNLNKIIPWNSDCRRNIGFLRAIEKGAEMVISIDDDNYVGNDDFYRYHSIVGKRQTLSTVRSNTRWFNPCSMLKTDNNSIIYSRGFPFSKRYKEKYTFTQTTGKVAMNMGLWISDPDVDAVTHLANPTKIDAIKEEINSIMLSPLTFSPINTQNTAFHRDVLPCYYYIPMNANLKGLKIDRYGDIWSGFFVKKAIDRMDERITMGKPLIDHRRNSHNYLNDLRHELWGMILTERIAEWLENLQLESNNYFDIYLELAKNLEKLKSEFSEYSIKKYFSKIVDSMRIWVHTCEKIMGA